MSEKKEILRRHWLGVLCGIAAGVWLGAAEAPTKLVVTGLSPYAISLCMVAGVFVARWSFPTLMRGTRSVLRDLSEKPHLIAPAVIAGMLWAVANTLTVFAIRDVGLAIAFPLWNTNSLVGIFWGWLLFGELKGASAKNLWRVLLGALAIVVAAILLGYSTLNAAGGHHERALWGIAAALGASLLWGTMYVPYRKAYLSGMTPLSFVTVFTVGELGAMIALVLAFDGGTHAQVFHAAAVRGVLFWLFLGGFVWVIGDLFQQYATKFLGIGRGIPLANTNQIWGLAWGVLVFGELAHSDGLHRVLALSGSAVMIVGALLVSSAVETEREAQSTAEALERECNRYGLKRELMVEAAVDAKPEKRSLWDAVILIAAVAIFVVLGRQAEVPALQFDRVWTIGLGVVMLVTVVVGARALWRYNKFS